MKKIILATIIVLISAVALKSDWGLFDGIISTNSITNVTTTSAVSGGFINLMEDDGDVDEKGIVWNTSANPTNTPGGYLGRTQEGDGPTSGNSLSYSSDMTGLTLNTTYYVRAYLDIDGNISYGQQIVFTTIPTLGEWGVIALVSLMGIFGAWMIYKRI